MAMPYGLAGFMAGEDFSQRQEQGQLQQAQSLMALIQAKQKMEQDAEMRGLMATGNVDEIAKRDPARASSLIQLMTQRAALDKAQREQKFNTEVLPTFMTQGKPAQPGVQSVAFQGGVGPDRPAVEPRFDVRGALEAKVRAGLIDPLTYQKELDALTKPVAVGRGGLAARDAAGNWSQVVAPTPSQQNVSPVARLIAERDALHPNDPRVRIYDQAITHATNPQAQRIIIPPQPSPPVAVMGPDGKPVLVSREDAIGKQPASAGVGKPIPAPITKAYSENNAALKKVDSALAELEAYPSGVGLQNIVGDTIAQRVDNKGVKLRALVADIGSLKIHDRSGAAVTAKEFPRLQPFIPNVKDTPETVKTKLEQFRSEYAAIQNDLQSIYGEDQGYRSFPQVGKSPASPAVPTAPTASTSVPTATGPNGQKLYLRNGQWQSQ